MSKAQGSPSGPVKSKMAGRERGRAHARKPANASSCWINCRSFADLIARIERAITTPSVWGARPQAGQADVLLTWRQLLALHRQWHSLIRELKDAELALGEDNSETNYARLQDVKARLSSIDGTEALIEGFGASSGRPARSL